jgi:putative pyruvate formate lyase activating enzyme
MDAALCPGGRTELTDRDLRARVAALEEIQRCCELCPRRCRVDRVERLGYCQQPRKLAVAIACAHRGEEPPLSGTSGAGTIFVCGCNMRCRFCQNHQISHRPPSPERVQSTAALAQSFLRLEREGCHNIEWVSPTQHLPGLVEALRLARAEGLRIPVVYNSNGYERVTVLRLLQGIVDVYLPDAKYSRNDLAGRLSGTSDYVEVNREAVLEMWRQVGPLELDPGDGTARRGVLLRHLVLPGQLENTREVLRWIAESLGPEAWVSLMAQYFPAGEAVAAGQDHAALGRPLTPREYRRAVDHLSAAGLENGWVQELSSGDRFLPDFDRPDPFARHGGSPT